VFPQTSNPDIYQATVDAIEAAGGILLAGVGCRLRLPDCWCSMSASHAPSCPFRQHPRLGSTQLLPILNDASLSAQTDTMSLGAQNYLVRPFRAHDLVGIAFNSAARAIRHFASRDLPTGLFNYDRIHELPLRRTALSARASQFR
jgi:hypothetical protein